MNNMNAYNKSIQPEDVPGMPTHHLNEDDKKHLESKLKNRPAEHIRHMGNHLHNIADKLSDHARNNVKYSDYLKAMKRGDKDMDGDSAAKDTDNDGM